MMRVPVILLACLIVAVLVAFGLVFYFPDRIDLVQLWQLSFVVHWFGMDDLGCDVLVRVFYGVRVSLLVGLLSVVIAGVVGVVIGGVAGYFGGAIDALLMCAIDAMLVILRLSLLMIAVALLQPSVLLLVVLIGLVGWMEIAWVVRAEFRALRGVDFVESARVVGAGYACVILYHLLPNAVQGAIVAIMIAVGCAILIESALSFFGVGVRLFQVSWGNMLYQLQAMLVSEFWLVFALGVFILLTTISVNLIGDRLV